jgi:hypothetical protein
MNGQVPTRFSIVVQGSLHPPLHHPASYEQVGILTAAEAAHALRSPTSWFNSNGSDFAFGSTRIRCLRGQWAIATTRPGPVERAVTIAAATFNRHRDTPVSAFQINFDYVREVQGPDVPAILLRAALDAPVGLEERGSLGAAIEHRRALADGVTVYTLISPAENPREVEVQANYERVFAELAAHDLARLISTDFPVAQSEAERQLTRTLGAMNRPGRK